MRHLLALLPLAACAVDPSTDTTEGGALGKADGQTKTVRVIQAGAFRDDQTGPIGYVPRLLHIGFTTERGPDWQDVQDIEIRYDADHKNYPVTVEVPAEHTEDLLAFVMYQESYYTPGVVNYRRWSGTNAYIDLAKHDEGTLVKLPVNNSAGYPFSNACYAVYVDGTNYPGKLTNVWYGFTHATQADYHADNNVAWLDASDEPNAEGSVPARHQHDGGYKGTYQLLPEYVWVPAGENLVFKLGIDKWSSPNWSYCGGDQTFHGHAETKTYFLDI